MGLLSFETCRANYFLFLFFFIESIADTHIYRYMINKFIYTYIKMSRSGSYMKSPEALYKKLNLLSEIYFNLITFCQYERTCVMYLSEFLYPSYGVFGSYLAPFCKAFIICLIPHIWKCI